MFHSSLTHDDIIFAALLAIVCLVWALWYYGLVTIEIEGDNK